MTFVGRPVAEGEAVPSIWVRDAGVDPALTTIAAGALDRACRLGLGDREVAALAALPALSAPSPSRAASDRE